MFALRKLLLLFEKNGAVRDRFFGGVFVRLGGNMNKKYLFEGRLAIESIVSWTTIVLGAFGIIFFLVGLGLVFAGRVDGSLGENLTVVGIFLAMFLCLLYFGIRKRKRLNAVKMYGQLFRYDQDGYVTVKELQALSGLPREKIEHDLKLFFSKGYFKNCTLQSGGCPCVVLSATGDSSAFMVVQCQSCGAANRIRIGMRGKCEYCGQPL